MHAGGMGKRARPATFAAVVAALPPVVVTEEPVAPGRLTSEVAVDPAGKAYRQVVGDLSGALAQLLVSRGALVVWDSCGCGGYCPVDWLDEAQRTALVAGPVPRVRPRDRPEASMSQWRAEDGASLVVLAGPVRWAGTVPG